MQLLHAAQRLRIETLRASVDNQLLSILLLPRGNTASVLRIMPYAAIHFSVYEHYRRLIKEFIFHEDSMQQQQPRRQLEHKRQQGALKMEQTQTGDEKEREATAAVARLLERPNALQHPEGDRDLRHTGGISEEERLAAVAMVVDRVMEESSASGSSIDVTAAIVAAKAQVGVGVGPWCVGDTQCSASMLRGTQALLWIQYMGRKACGWKYTAEPTP